MNGKITISKWLREESPVCAGFCEMINIALEKNPNISLAEFAEQIDKGNKEYEEIRLRTIIDRQLNEIFGGEK